LLCTTFQLFSFSAIANRTIDLAADHHRSIDRSIAIRLLFIYLFIVALQGVIYGSVCFAFLSD